MLVRLTECPQIFTKIYEKHKFVNKTTDTTGARTHACSQQEPYNKSISELLQ